MNYNVKIAYAAVPKEGGTYTFYKNIRKELAWLNFTMYCVAVGRVQADIWNEDYADENCILLAPNIYNVKKQAKEFVSWCIKENIDIVIGVNSEAVLSSIPHLPCHVRILSRCANAFDHGYRITLSGGDRVEAIVALTPRLKYDLINHYNAEKEIVELIPNGISPGPFSTSMANNLNYEEKLNLGFLGRLEHNQKGVMHLVGLVRQLNLLAIPFNLNIAGKGKDRDKLEIELRKVSKPNQVRFLGNVNPENVPNFLTDQHLFIFTSHFEGCPNALLEALMAGSIPLSWRINGITDFLIEDTRTGYLFEKGDYIKMAETVKYLNENRFLLKGLSHNARKEALKRFTPEKTAKSYALVFDRILQLPVSQKSPKPWSNFVADKNFRQKGDYWMPRRVKAILKRVLQ